MTRKIRLIVVLTAVLLASCSSQSSGETSPLTSIPVQLPPTWTPQPSPSIPAAQLVPDSVTPTSTPTLSAVPQEGAEIASDADPAANLVGADDWWLQFPGTALIN